MDRHFKTDLKRLVSDYAVNRRGPFGQWAHDQGKFAPALTNRELAAGFIGSYGPQLIMQLYQAKLARFYELDVAAVVGRERSRLVLGAAHKRLKSLNAAPAEGDKGTSIQAAIGLLTIVTGLVAALHFLGAKPENEGMTSAYIAPANNPVSAEKSGGGRGRD